MIGQRLSENQVPDIVFVVQNNKLYLSHQWWHQYHHPFCHIAMLSAMDTGPVLAQATLANDGSLKKSLARRSLSGRWKLLM